MAIKGGRGMKKLYPNITKWPVDCTIPKWVEEALVTEKPTKRRAEVNKLSLK